MKAATKDKLKTGVKLALGAGLVYYVLRSEMIDFELLQQVLWNPFNLLVSMAFFSGVAVCAATRWYFLVKAQGLALSFKDVVALTMIGNFFNTFMPGSVGGDLIKAYYVAGHEPTRKTKAIFTVLLDRAIGLSVIVFYAAVTLLFHFGWLAKHQELQAVGYSIWGFTGLAILGGFLFFTPKAWERKEIQAITGFFRKFKPLAKVLDAAFLYQAHIKTILIALLFSAISITCMILLWSFNGNGMGIDLPLTHYFFVVPIGLVASAVPLLPGGIGVGQVAFFTLFQWVGVANPEQGGALCTLMQIYFILFNFTGSLFYIRYKRKRSKLKTTQSDVSSLARRASVL